MDIAKILIVGRPNVGKSTFINRLLKKKAAITEDMPGVTRDLNEYLVTYKQKSFFVVDSGGVFAEKNNEFEFQEDVEALVQTAIYDMSVVVFVTDAQEGVLAADTKISNMLRDAVPEKVVLVANKADNEQLQTQVGEFCKLGFGEPIAVSSLHGVGVERVLQRATQGFSTSDQQQEGLKKRFKVGIVGRPNVGKSSMLNVLVNAERSIVNEKSGTTRDSIHVFTKHDNHVFEWIDTAGLRRRTKVKGSIEFYSTVRTKRSIKESDLVVMVIDAERGFCNQDKRIIQQVVDDGKSMLVFVNKADCLEEGKHIEKDFKMIIESEMPVLQHYPICFGSALTKQGLKQLLDKIPPMFVGIHDRIPTKMLNDFNRDVIRRFPPPAKYGKQVKIYYLTQVDMLPPTFVCFINHKKYLTTDYQRFLEKRIRAYLGGFEGHTIRLLFKERRIEAEPRRVHQQFLSSRSKGSKPSRTRGSKPKSPRGRQR